jgi:renalase
LKGVSVSYLQQPTRIAVIGSGLAGAACAAGLHQAELQVELFDKARGVGGRMSTRRAAWDDAHGVTQSASFDHGAPWFSARQPRFRAVLARAQAAGCVLPWQPRVHATWPAPLDSGGFVAVPDMPALCRHLVAQVPLRLDHPVQRLQRTSEGWFLARAGGELAGPFDHVMLALPPAQAAVLLAGHRDDWADSLVALPMTACWTLMAVTDDVDWPWDAAEPGRGPLRRVLRNDRKPGRGAPPGCATWVAQASAGWSAAHLEDDPQAVKEALVDALARLLPRHPAPRWHHAAVHRWRYAQATGHMPAGQDCWWDDTLGLGVCGDGFGQGELDAAWRSGDELADTVVAWLETSREPAEAA